MTVRQSRFLWTLMACALIALVASSATSGRPATGRSATAQASAAPSPTDRTFPNPRIAIAYDLGGGGSVDVSELARDGVKRAADELGADFTEVTTRPDDTDADRESRLAELADAHYYPIFAVGSTYAGPVAKVAPKYPGTWFGIVDDGTVDAPKVIGIQFNEAQGSFLVGAAAALTSKTGRIGFIGAAPVPLVERFEAGFTAGARAADRDIKVQVTYLSPTPGDTGPSDPAAARKAALDMYDAGADVIFGTVGDSGDGVIQAAHDRGRWAIGVDTDRYRTADPSVRDAILTSMLKRADVGTYTIAMEIAMGVPKDGNNVFGVDRGGVGYSTSGGFVDSIKDRLDAFAARIASGEILVPTTPRKSP